MRRSVLIVGDSPLSLLVARQLDSDLARLAHIDVTYLSRDDQVLYWPSVKSLLGKHPVINREALLRNVNFKKTEVKQVNLIDRRVITTKGIYDYDLLLLDLTPTFLSDEIERISQQCRRLITEVQSKLKTGHQLRSRITFAGEDAASWQAAAAIAADLSVHAGSLQRSISVQAQFPTWPLLKEFLAQGNVSSRKTVGLLSGLTIGSPMSPIKNRSVRGALLDDGDNFILRHGLNPEGHPDCIVVSGPERLRTNLWRVDQTLATRITDNIERFLEGARQRPLDLPKAAGVLRNGLEIFGWLGRLESRRWRARALAALDRRFYQRVVE